MLYSLNIVKYIFQVEFIIELDLGIFPLKSEGNSLFDALSLI